MENIQSDVVDRMRQAESKHAILKASQRDILRFNALKQPYVMRETSSRVGPFLETTQSLPGTIFSSTSYFSLLQGLDELLGLDHNKI